MYRLFHFRSRQRSLLPESCQSSTNTLIHYCWFSIISTSWQTLSLQKKRLWLKPLLNRCLMNSVTMIYSPFTISESDSKIVRHKSKNRESPHPVGADTSIITFVEKTHPCRWAQANLAGSGSYTLWSWEFDRNRSKSLPTPEVCCLCKTPTMQAHILLWLTQNYTYY